MNGNGAKWKELADRAETKRNTLCKYVGGQVLFAGLLHLYAAVFMEMWDRKTHHNLNKLNAKRETEILMMRATPSRQRGHPQFTKSHGQW
jgi:hypothetical protein